MTVHKLSAGVDGGYSYLTRQVASADQRRAFGALADYYAARGNPPGIWLGKGAEQLGVAGDEVTEAQMRALFGHGLHPDAEAIARRRRDEVLVQRAPRLECGNHPSSGVAMGQDAERTPSSRSWSTTATPDFERERFRR
jgi:hypothetical protein